MYAASYFNSVGIVQRFAAWARDRRTTASPYPQEILFRATAVMMAVRSASQSAALCASKLDGVQFDTGDDSREVAFWCDDVVGLVGMVCHALSSLVVLQNQVIRLVGDTVEPRVEDLPKSLHGVMRATGQSDLFATGNQAGDQGVLGDDWRAGARLPCPRSALPARL